MENKKYGKDEKQCLGNKSIFETGLSNAFYFKRHPVILLSDSTRSKK